MTTHPGIAIREARLKQHLSVREVHRRSGVSIPTIREIERGLRDPYDYTVAKLRDALGLNDAPEERSA